MLAEVDAMVGTVLNAIPAVARENTGFIKDAVFYSTYPLLYHTFRNSVIFRSAYIHFVAQETRIIRKLFLFIFHQKGRNRGSKFDTQKCISLNILRFIDNYN